MCPASFLKEVLHLQQRLKLMKSSSSSSSSSLVVLGIVLVLACLTSNGKAQDSGLKKLQWYMHDIVGGKNATTVTVAGPNGNVTGFNQLGSVIVIDDILTETPSHDSKAIGRAQGCYMADSLHSFSLLMSFTAILPNGTLSFHGQDPVFDTVREISVVGGTGVYRFVTGYAEIRTNFFDTVTGSAILKFDVFLKACAF